MIITLGILLASLVGLIVAAEFVVRGSVALALRLHVPPLLIGLTIVAFGTSAPELLVSAEAALSGMPGLSLGNIIGSNVANVFLVLGVPAIIYPIAANQPTIRRNTSFMLAATVLFIYFCWGGALVFWQGAVMFGLIVVFLFLAGLRVANGHAKDPNLRELVELSEVGNLPDTKVRIAILLIVGLIGLPVSSHYLVESASAIANIFGVSNAMIGLSIVALGTSLPELATTVAAALHKQSAMAIGNVIGSNLFNILGVMGVTAMLTDVPVPGDFTNANFWIMLGASFVLAAFVFTHRSIGRISGVFFLIAYIGFVVWNYTQSQVT